MTIVLFVISTLVMSAAAALAADLSPASDVRAACRADVEKLCPGVEPGRGRFTA
ncbi:MAG TPA: hypothetical protein VEN29_09095 [Casimicrobiaceae bacterium]|nr:hypothetical protein [Casimicrobiaceae bacterium]